MKIVSFHLFCKKCKILEFDRMSWKKFRVGCILIPPSFDSIRLKKVVLSVFLEKKGINYLF
jgi:hypothetical protein